MEDQEQWEKMFQKLNYENFHREIKIISAHCENIQINPGPINLLKQIVKK